MHDNRRQVRHSLAAELWCTPADRSLAPFLAKSRNISAGGIFIENGEVALAVDDRLTISIVPDKGTVLTVEVQVVHVRPHIGVGCVFLRVAPNVRATLQRWLGPSGGMAPVAGTIEVS